MYVTGPVGQAADSAEAFEGIDGTLLLATLGVVIVILLITYRSPMLWLLPVLSAGVALTVAQAVIYLLAEHAGLTVNGQSAGILTVLVFGAGTDYALLLVARYREELRRHEDRHEAMAVALHRAGPAIIASAATVIVGMLCLLFAEMNSTAGLGPVAAIGVAVGAAGHDDAAAGAAGHLRPVALLAGPAALRLGRADRRAASGRGSAAGSPAGPRTSGWPPRWCSACCRSASSSSTPTGCPTRSRSSASRTRSSARRCSTEHFPDAGAGSRS